MTRKSVLNTGTLLRDYLEMLRLKRNGTDDDDDDPVRILPDDEAHAQALELGEVLLYFLLKYNILA